MFAAVAGVLAVALVGIPATPAEAHAQLVSSDPAHGEVLDVAPGQVVLQFNEQVDPPSDAIEVFDADGDEVSIGSLQVTGAEVSAELPALDDRAYVVSWRVISADSHPIAGAFLFYVGEAAGAEDAEALLDELRSGSGADRTLGVVYGGARLAVFVGLSLLVGGALFVTFLWPAGAAERRSQRLIGAGWLLVVVATVAGFGFQAAYAAGGSWADMIDGDRLGDVLGTRTGRTWLVRLGLLAVVPVAWRRLFPPWRHSSPAPAGSPARAGGGAVHAHAPHPVAVVVLGGALLATVSFAGHAATGRLVAAALVVDVVHLSAAVFWLAGLVLLLTVVLRSGGGQDEGEPSGVDGAPSARTIATRFSPLALGAVVAVVVTGTFQGWRQVGGLDALTDSTYGRLLLAKVALVAFMVGIAVLSRSTVRRWAAGSPARLRRSVGAEAVVAGVVLAVTAGLVNTVPARDAGAATAFEAELHGIHVAVAVTVDPAEAGPVDLTLQVLTHAGDPLAVEDLSANLSLDERSISRLEMPVEPDDTTGSYVASAADIPYAGTWELEVVVRRSEIDQERLTVEVPVS